MNRLLLWLLAIPAYLRDLSKVLAFRLSLIFDSRKPLFLCEITQYGDMVVNLGNYHILQNKRFKLFIITFLDPSFIQKYVPNAWVMKVPFRVSNGWYWRSLCYLLARPREICLTSPVPNEGSLHFASLLRCEQVAAIDILGEQYEIEQKHRSRFTLFNSFSSKVDKPHVANRALDYYKNFTGIEMSRELYHQFYENLNIDSKGRDVILVPQAGNAYRDMEPTQLMGIIESFSKMDYSVRVLGTRNIVLPETCEDMIGKTNFLEACELIRGASMVIGAETSLIHFAHLIGKPTICLSGGGDYGKFIPWSEKRANLKVVTWNDHSCFGCSWDCEFEVLGLTTAPCIKNIELEAVYQAIQEFSEV